MSYKPEPLPLDIEGMTPALRELWERDAEDLHQAQFHSQDRALFTKFAAPPAKPEKGGLYYADGSTWNPGDGEGLYIYSQAGTFVFLGQGIDVRFFGASTSNADNGPAFNLAEATLSAGQKLIIPPGIFTFTTPIATSRQKPIWIGAGENSTALRYTGASTTVNLISFDNSLSGIEGVDLSGFCIQSSTVMTAGYALFLRRSYESSIAVSIQGRIAFAALGNAIFNGIYFKGTDTAKCISGSIFCKNNGITVNGDLGAFRADLFIDRTTIVNCAVGILVAGGFGGLYIQNVSMGINANHITFDQSLEAATNRECFISQGVFDVTTGGGAGVKFTAADGLLFQATGAWFASAAGIGIDVQAPFLGKILLTGCRIYNNAGDGVRVSSASCNVSLIGCHIHNNGGYGINPNVAAHIVAYVGCYMAANTLGDINPANAPNVSNIGFGSHQRLENLSLIDFNNDATQLQITNTGTNGAGIKLTGNGGSTPSKVLRVNTGLLQILNDAFSAAILQITDGGSVTIGPSPSDATWLNIQACTAARSSIRTIAGVAPASPVDGDIWFNGTNLFMRIGGLTKTFTII